ncbi:tyrosine-type recombinase/integrase [Roseiconus lacunae]|uniref:tyrosine-type recombinase/integrase n=1 Tax=Roseiconus lacunae TaxID=2605694 RepID=UPI0011F0C642|nr:tyrosine-type recombinase/integrase [Roseiconus lacunae]
MTLAELIEDYDLQHEVSADYIYQLTYAARRFGTYLGHDATIDDLETRSVNSWLKSERDQASISDRSRQNVRTSILTLWKFSRRPLNRDQIRSVVVTPRNPEAWHFDELSSVASAAEKLPGSLSNGIERSLYMTTCLWFAFETGLRRRDIWDFDISRLDAEGNAVFTQHKTNRVHIVRVTTETFDSMKKISRQLQASREQDASKPLKWPQCVSQFYYWMRECREKAGVDAATRNRSLQHIRRTGATAVESAGDQGYKYLGHSRDGLAQRSYVDVRKTAQAVSPRVTRPTKSETRNDQSSGSNG